MCCPIFALFFLVLWCDEDLNLGISRFRLPSGWIIQGLIHGF